MPVSVLITVEGTSPEISRCINVEQDMTLGEFAQVIDASLGFSGASSHLFVGTHGTRRQVYAENPGAGEDHEDTITVGEMEPMTYIYDAAADWSIHVEVLGPSHIEGPTPMLVDVAGPDVIESCNGPALMTEFRNQARLLAAGIEPNLETVTLMFSFLPVMPPERMLDRLTIADPVTVASRIANVAEEQFFDEVAGVESDGMGLADHFDDFINSRPELREIIDLDPHPERNPNMISAVTDFFNDMLGGDDDLTLTELVTRLVSLFADGVTLEGGVALPEMIDAEIQALTQMQHARGIADLIVESGLAKKRGDTITLTKAGKEFLASGDPLREFDTHFRRMFEALIGPDEWRTTVRWFIGDPPGSPQPSTDEFIPWLCAFRVIVGSDPGDSRLSDEGRQMMHRHLAFYNRM